MQRNNGSPACASCRHQRKRCTDKCVLAPFFPVDKNREFQAVHKVFGVSNVTKIVRNLNEEDRKRAVDSLVWEAFCRQKDPVLGPYGEFRRVYEELKMYKSQYQQFHHQLPTQEGVIFKSAPSFIGWNSNSNNETVLNYIHKNNNNNGNSMGESWPYTYSSHHGQNMEKLRQERENGSVILPQQHPTNGFNQQYYMAGQHNPIEAKQVESTIWESGA